VASPPAGVSPQDVARRSFGSGVSLSHALLSEPDSGTVNTHPKALPWQLPRTRRGRKRPAAISVQAARSAPSPAVEKWGLSAEVRSSRGSLLIGLLSILCSLRAPLAQPCGITSTSQPFDVGMPVPPVSPPISLQVGGP